MQKKINVANILGEIIFLGLFNKKEWTSRTLKINEGNILLLIKNEAKSITIGAIKKNIPFIANFNKKLIKNNVSNKNIDNTAERKLKANK